MNDKNKCKNTILIERLKALIDTKTREEVASGIGCDTSLVTKHYNEDRAVTIEYLVKYARYFQVSTDYLVGLEEVSTTDKNKAFVCEYTGLTEKAIGFFSYLNDDYIYSSDRKKTMLRLANYMLEKSCFSNMLYYAAEYCAMAHKINTEYQKMIQKTENTNSYDSPFLKKEIYDALYFKDSNYDSARLYYFEAVEKANALIRECLTIDGDIEESHRLLETVYKKYFGLDEDLPF